MILSVVIRTIFIILGAYSVLDGFFMSLVSNANFGNYLTSFLGAVLIFVGVFWKFLGKSSPKWLKISFFTLLCITLVFSLSLYFYGKTDSVTYNEDAVIVLGAGIRGERPSLTLKGRLDAAFEYHKDNPDAIIVVSGGKGHDEDITEALAMEKYLTNLGVPERLIIKEEKSTSTFENFSFSKEILDGLFENGYKCAYITNEYHVFRAGQIAKKAGFEAFTHTHSDTIWHSVLPGVLRECTAVIKYFLLGN